MNTLKKFWRQIRDSFWFVPSLITSIHILLALALIEADSSGSPEWMDRLPLLFGANAAGARSMLATIIGTTMTVVGVTFSIVLMTLALASSQYTSRILRNFIRDRVTQIGLGIFAGIFTYCLIVLRTVRGGDEETFIPSLAITLGVLLAIGGISVLIFFIHHIATAIQASSIIAAVAEETLEAVDHLFPEKLGHIAEEDHTLPPTLPADYTWHAVPSPENGYIQNVENPALLRLARKYGTVIKMERRIGEFVVRNTPLALLSLKAPPDKKLTHELQSAYSIERHRTVEQDLAFGIRQLVDIALRALSPGVNDTTTAVMCVDYLTAILSRLASRAIPSPYRYEGKELRVIAIGATFSGLVAESFDEIRASAKGNVTILLRMIGALHTISTLTASPFRRQVLASHLQHIAELADRTIKAPHDRHRIENALAEVHKALTGNQPTLD